MWKRLVLSVRPSVTKGLEELQVTCMLFTISLSPIITTYRSDRIWKECPFALGMFHQKPLIFHWFFFFFLNSTCSNRFDVAFIISKGNQAQMSYSWITRWVIQVQVSDTGPGDPLVFFSWLWQEFQVALPQIYLIYGFWIKLDCSKTGSKGGPCQRAVVISCCARCSPLYILEFYSLICQKT